MKKIVIVVNDDDTLKTEIEAGLSDIVPMLTFLFLGLNKSFRNISEEPKEILHSMVESALEFADEEYLKE